MPYVASPNLIGGYAGNMVSVGVAGATIAGGGEPGHVCGDGDDACWNQVTANYATVSGGAANTASFLAATVGGGYSNTASQQYAAVGGGGFNAANGFAATVPGGAGNTAAGDFSFAAGRRAKAVHPGSFVWADSADFDFGSTTPDQFAVRANGGVLLVAGPGAWRMTPHPDSPNLIGGHSANSVTAEVYGATIGGGGSGASPCSTSPNCWNIVGGNYGTIGGGAANKADGQYATIGGAMSTPPAWKAAPWVVASLTTLAVPPPRSAAAT